ncbi:hypothetical protein CDAR_465141 [Caerostris darwini]|uniref:Uncharacterized protein n=1 Tax=Caerostris darwini TaxID=1538125 RepID=A0AAV4V1M2_9ARAC|nr:hypothetical protein CDAR_465141 [Caerostris darwini]
MPTMHIHITEETDGISMEDCSTLFAEFFPNYFLPNSKRIPQILLFCSQACTARDCRRNPGLKNRMPRQVKKQPENTPFKNSQRMYGPITQSRRQRSIGVGKECIDASGDHERMHPSTEARRVAMHPRKGGHAGVHSESRTIW